MFSLSADILILGLAVVVIADPSLVHDKIGGGFPLAVHEKVTLNPSTIVLLAGFVVNAGFADPVKKHTFC